VYRKEGMKRAKVRRGKIRRARTFSEFVHPLTSAYVYLSGNRVRANPSSSAAIKLPFPTV